MPRSTISDASARFFNTESSASDRFRSSPSPPLRKVSCGCDQGQLSQQVTCPASITAGPGSGRVNQVIDRIEVG